MLAMIAIIVNNWMCLTVSHRAAILSLQSVQSSSFSVKALLHWGKAREMPYIDLSRFKPLAQVRWVL